MPSTDSTLDPNPPISLPQPREVYNCPQCSHYITPGTLACPECRAMVYSDYLQQIGVAAQSLEQQERWPEARAAWVAMIAYLPPGTKQHDAIAQRVQAIDGKDTARVERKAKWTKRLGPFAPILVLFSKLKFLFVLLKLKFLFSFFAFFGYYWAIFGWKFGLGGTLGILLHEMGHYITAKRRGLSVDLPLFLPGFGAYVKWRSQGTTLVDLADIALAGPFYGLGGALVCGAISRTFHSELFGALTHFMAWLNLLNLIPVFFLDGALAAKALSSLQRIQLIVTGVLFFFATQQKEWVFLLIAAGMVWQAFQSDAPEEGSNRTMVGFVVLFFGLGTLIWLFPLTRMRF